jgi:chromosome segregation protein
MQKQKEESRVMLGRKNNLQNEISGINNQYFSLKSKLEQQKSALSKVSLRVADIDKHMQSGGEGRFDDEAFLETISALRNKHAEISERVQMTRRAIDESNYSLSKQSNLYNQQNIVFVQQQNKITGLLRDLSYQKTLVENLSVLIRDNGAELEKVQVQIGEIISNAADYDNKLVEMYQDKEGQERAVAAVEAEYYKSRGHIEEAENHIREIRKRKEQADLLLQSIRDKVTEIRIQLNSLKERLGAEFGINIEDCLHGDQGKLHHRISLALLRRRPLRPRTFRHQQSTRGRDQYYRSTQRQEAPFHQPAFRRRKNPHRNCIAFRNIPFKARPILYFR